VISPIVGRAEEALLFVNRHAILQENSHTVLLEMIKSCCVHLAVKP
jgi:hypothetical protein